MHSELTIQGTKFDQALIELKSYTKNNTKLYNQEISFVTPLQDALSTEVSVTLDEQINRSENIKTCLDNLAKHKLIIGSVFVGIGTAKYWKKMSRFCNDAIIVPIKNIKKRENKDTVLNQTTIDALQSKIKFNFNTMEGKSKEQHNKDAQEILDAWNYIVGNNGKNVTKAYHLVPKKTFDDMYKLISNIVKTGSALHKLVLNNGRNTTGNVYWNLFSAIKDTQRNWNSYKK